MGDDPVYGFKAGVTLPQLLPAIRNIRLQRVAMDFNAMGCPLNVLLTYRQPDLPNAVGELDSPDPARAPLLDWLRATTLDLPERTLDAVYGDTLGITVPCTKLDLQPPETRQ